MNYKNNLLTKKKYKIVNQKAGSMNYWPFCVSYRDFPPNRVAIKYLEKISEKAVFPHLILKLVNILG